MIDGFDDVLSKEVLVGVTLYFGVAYLAAGPISERIATRDHLPGCIEHKGRTAQTVQDEGEQLARELYGGVMKQLPGPLGELLSGAADAAKSVRERQMQERAKAVAASAPDECRCRMAVALSETRTEWALYVGTLKLYRTPAVDNFGRVMSENRIAQSCERRT